MSIKKLPEYIINRLKAGEIVERPASILKELIENALDATCTQINVYLNDGGKKLIMVQDDGVGIDESDMDMVLERYATSKIFDEEDLHHINSYGFRGEALATIAEVSHVTVHSKTKEQHTGMELNKKGTLITRKKIPTSFDHGTTVIIEDVFFNVPARKKFLKSSQTEYFYMYEIFINFALVNRNIGFSLTKQEKQVFNLAPAPDLASRIVAIYKKEWLEHLIILEHQDPQHHVYGMIGDATLRFGSAENIKIFVNKRPVTDRVIKKAILDAYRRQLGHGEYPLAIIFIEIDPGLVDVNVHPRKLEVRFLNPGSVFQLVKNTLASSLGTEQITSMGHHMQAHHHMRPQHHSYGHQFPTPEGEDEEISTPVYHKMDQSQAPESQGSFAYKHQYTSAQPTSIGNHLFSFHSGILDTPLSVHGMFLVGQIWDSYIILQDETGLFYVDQHALAERIIYETMKKNAQDGFVAEPLLQPVTITLPRNIPLEEKLAQCNELGFDISLFGENKIIIHAVPQIFAEHVIDFDVLFQKVLSSEDISFDLILEEIFASKACKAAIKAGQRLSPQEMKQLIEDGFASIDQLFVCQHGRPFFIKIARKDIDGLFGR